MTWQASLGHALSSSLCMPLRLSETLLPLRSTLFPSCPLNRADLLVCFYQWMQKKWHYGASEIGLKSLECWETEYTHDPSPITDNDRTLTTAGPGNQPPPLQPLAQKDWDSGNDCHSCYPHAPAFTPLSSRESQLCSPHQSHRMPLS